MLKGLWTSGKGMVKFFAAVLLGYLVQACIMPYLAVDDVTASMLFAVVAVLTVCFGRLRAFWCGGVYGIVMEVMSPAISYFNLLLYPISAILCAIPFADKSEKRLEYERSLDKRAKDLNPLLRTVLCAGMNAVIYQIINLTYVYLGGSDVSFTFIWRGVEFVLLTVLTAAVIMLPLRAFLGFGRRKTPKLKTPAVKPA